jgi:hypothetical protein
MSGLIAIARAAFIRMRRNNLSSLEIAISLAMSAPDGRGVTGDALGSRESLVLPKPERSDREKQERPAQVAAHGA